MLSLDDMLKELGSVTIRYSAGAYLADAGRAFLYGETECSRSVEGAVWNVLLRKREQEAGCVPNSKRAGIVSGIQADHVPTAGQESY